MTSKIRRTGALAATAALAFTLVSCSGGQSTAEACQIANDTMNSAVDQMNSDVQGALQGAVGGEDIDFGSIFAPVTEALHETQSKVTNEEVKGALDTFVDEYTSFAATIEGFDLSSFGDMSDIDPSDPDAMQKLEEMQASAEELQTTLTEQTASMQEAAAGMQEVCGS